MASIPLHRGGYLHEHTVVGDRLCSKLHSLQAIRPIARTHHERLDGTGYPDGLRGDSVPPLAQIISIADAFDAITSIRAYHDRKSASHAIDVLNTQAAIGWRRDDLVAAFTDLVLAGKLGPIAA